MPDNSRRADSQTDDLVIRTATPADDPAVLALMASSLGWLSDDTHERFMTWKHRANPFGTSPAWIAEADGQVIGFRTFLRWRYRWQGRTWSAVRAVDTATAPEARGKGVFKRLTLAAIDDLQAEGVDFIFNTPNDSSRPGYLKMGWRMVAALPVFALPASPAALVRMARAKVPADMWSQPSTAGVDAAEALADGDAVTRLLASQPEHPERIRTDIDLDYLRWRFTGYPDLAYRALLAGDDPSQGLALFRVRRRGTATEAALAEVLVPGGDPRAIARLARKTARAAKVDYALQIGAVRPGLGGLARGGFLRVPGSGPTLVWRTVNEPVMPTADRWDLTIGDVELF